MQQPRSHDSFHRLEEYRDQAARGYRISSLLRPSGEVTRRLTQRLGERGRRAAAEHVVNLVLQVHDGGKRPVASGAAAAVLPKGSGPVARRPEPRRQRPVQSRVQHVKPERPVGPTPQPREAGGRRRGGRRRRAGSCRLLFGLRMVEWRRRFPPAAGAVLTERAVAVQEAAAARRVGGQPAEAAVSEERPQRVSALSRGGERAAGGGGGGGEAHLAHARTELWEEDGLAAPRAGGGGGGGARVRAGGGSAVTGMVTHGDVSKLEAKKKQTKVIKAS